MGKKKDKNELQKVTFLRGPIGDNLARINEDEQETLFQSFKLSIENDLKRTYRDYVKIGFNSVVRCLERNEINGIIMADPFTVYVQQNIYDLAISKSIPIIFVDKLNEQLKGLFNVSSLLCFAFKNNINQPESSLKQTFQAFEQIAKKYNCNNKNLTDIKNSALIKIENSENLDEKSKINENQQQFIAGSFADELRKPVSLSLTTNLPKIINEAENKIYFPDRVPDDYFDISLTIESKEIQNISIEAISKKGKRKTISQLTQQQQEPAKKTKAITSVYKQPNIVKLTPSIDNVNKRKKKQQLKKEAKKKKKSLFN